MKDVSSNAAFVRRNAVATLGTQSKVWPVSDREAASPAHLTPRQLEVLALLCEGLPNKLICRKLSIATGTVKVHISCILRELGVTSRLQAVVAVGSLGLPGKLMAGE